MLQITNLSDNAHQKTTILLNDNTSVVVTLDFLPRIQKWIMGVSRSTFLCNGLSVCVHPNMLRSFRKNVPFGIACFAPDGVDPFDISDFINGRIKLYVLDNTAGLTDVDDIEKLVYG
jgi:hypothetical protein